MTNFGVKVSKTGFDVNNASSPNLIYSSKYSNFKIHSILTKVLTVPAGIQNINGTIDNPISYPPFFIPYVNDSNNSTRWYETRGWCGITDDSGAAVYCDIRYNVVTNNFTCSVHTFANWDGGTVTFKIVILVDVITGEVAQLSAVDSFGLKVSKDNEEVEKTEDSNLSLTSKFRNLTIFSTGTISTKHTTGDSATVTHNLGYVPMVASWQEIPSDPLIYQKLPSVYVVDGGGTAGLGYQYITKTTLVITDNSYTGNPDINYHYIIFNEKLT